MSQLVTHLLASVETGSIHGRFTTACGKVGIPIVMGHVFHATSDRFEGRRPASAGGGIVAVREIRFGVPNRVDRYCERCMKRWQAGEGI